MDEDLRDTKEDVQYLKYIISELETELKELAKNMLLDNLSGNGK